MVSPVNVLPPPHIDKDELDVPDLQAWIKYINKGGNPNQDIFGTPLILVLFKVLACTEYDDQLEKFSELIDLLLRKGVNPNVKCDSWEIHNNNFSNLAPLHILYLYWKLRDWSEQSDKVFEEVFNRMLNDPKVDIRTTFSEEFSDRTPDWDSMRSCDGDYHVSLRNLLEEATLFHYASSLGDTETVDKLIQRDPDLIHLTCFTVCGKNLLTYRSASQQEDDENSIHKTELESNQKGIIAIASSRVKDPYVFNVERIVRVTPLHIAAREAHPITCGFLVGRSAYRGALDSSGGSPYDYLMRAFQGWKNGGGLGCYGEHFSFRADDEVKALGKLLKYLPSIPKSLPLAHCLIHKVGYSILYDNRLKIPVYVYECLTEENLEKNATRGTLGFTQDHEVPNLNRSKNSDYAHSGYHKGHSRAAANAVQSEEAMRDTFKLSNAFPEDPSHNLGYWKALEGRVRELVKKNDCVEVFTGHLFLSKINKDDGVKRVSYKVIGGGEVAVPTHCYKVLFIHKKRTMQQLAYLLPNMSIKTGKNLDSFLVTVEKIQILSGVIFSSHHRD